MNFIENLGKQGQDLVSGFKGTITGYVKYLYGCDQYLLIPKGKNNERCNGEWFDVIRIKILGDKKIELNTMVKKTNIKGAEYNTESSPINI